MGFPRERSRDGADLFITFRHPHERQESQIKVREAECRAAGLEIRPTELQVQIQQDSLAPMMDALALIGMSP